MYNEHPNERITEIESHDIDFIETDFPSIGCNIPGSDTLEYYSILSFLGLAPLRLCPCEPAFSWAFPSKDFPIEHVPHV